VNGFVPNSHGRRTWFLSRTSVKIKIKGQGHQGQKWHFRPFRRPAFGLCLVKHVSQNDIDVAHCNFNAHQPISVIFGRDVVEGVCYRMLIYYPTAPN